MKRSHYAGWLPVESSTLELSFLWGKMFLSGDRVFKPIASTWIVVPSIEDGKTRESLGWTPVQARRLETRDMIRKGAII